MLAPALRSIKDKQKRKGNRIKMIKTKVARKISNGKLSAIAPIVAAKSVGGSAGTVKLLLR